jgi:hypothetical protein
MGMMGKDFVWITTNKRLKYLQSSLGKLHKRVPNYSAFSLKGTNVAKRSIECMKLSKPFNVGYSVTLRSKSMTEAKTRAFHVIF